jgi:NADH:ubiquinone reductase (H+-translocating)
VVVGGGFAGLQAARGLAHAPVQVVLIDRQNYHLFQPLLYQVATAALSPGDIAEPMRAILRKQANVRVVLAEVTGVDVDRRRVLLGSEEVTYDYLVLASGARHAYFGHDEWEALAPGLKTLDDALEIRRRILMAFERAEIEPDPAAREALLTFVIVGGGPTGVELAGAIAEIARHTVARDFRSIDPRRARIILVEGAPRLLPPYPPDLSAAAEHDLRRLGVEVRTDALVTRLTPEAAYVGEEAIPTRTVLWAAGVAASAIGRDLGAPLDRSGRVLVNPDLSVPGHPEVYVVGDLAAVQSGGKPVPGVAPAAMQQGKHAAHNIVRSTNGQPSEPFQYWNRGNLATIGRGAAVADLGRLHLEGLPAWLAWLTVHLFFLIGFENRVLVLLQWAYAYLTYERGARLITRGWPERLRPG